MSRNTSRIGMFALALVLLGLLAGCGGDKVNYFKNDGSYCVPEPDSRTEDCYVGNGPTRGAFRVTSTADLETICTSECKKIHALEVDGTGMDGLKNLKAFQGLTIVGSAWITRNSNLKSTEGLHLQDGTSLYIDQNPSLETVYGLEDVVTAKTIDINFNPNVETIHGLDNFEELLNQKEADGEQIQNKLHIARTKVSSLHDLDGLELNEGSTFRISYNSNLERIPEISGGKVGSVLINDNNSLTDIEGLRGIDALYQLEVAGNSSLKNCHIQDVIDGIERWGPDITRKMYVADNSSASCD